MDGLHQNQRDYISKILSGYWRNNGSLISELPIPVMQVSANSPSPPKMDRIPLPDWAQDIGVEGGILIPHELISGETGSDWQKVDWLGAAFWYLNGTAERAFEQAQGPIHSNSFRLKGWDPRIWERAWVNRIALFLRRWAANQKDRDELDLFGPLPEPKIILTHDVDAVHKTFPIRLKQTAFLTFNALRNILKGDPGKALDAFRKAARFFFSKANYWCFDQIINLEKEFSVYSHFNFYGGQDRRFWNLKKYIFDPGYDIQDLRLRNKIRDLSADGWRIGLHQSFDSWENPELMRREKKRLEQVSNGPVSVCRQHWLRFGWASTWHAQQEAGFELDTTLGFNDRPGFRNGAALRFHPWDSGKNEPMRLQALPMVLMDSHLYDYEDLDEEERLRKIDHWVQEIKNVSGEATVVWHQRIMSPDYGWGPSYKHLLDSIKS